MDPTDEVRAWASSGALALTGPRPRPLGPPAGMVTALRSLGERVAAGSGALGTTVELDPLELLVERAAIAGFGRAGVVSCGGETRLLCCADGWVALCLARPEDRELLPAWLGVAPGDDPWPAVEDALSTRDARAAVDDGALLGLALAALPVRSPRPPMPEPVATRSVEFGDAPSVASLAGVRVIDLTSLWAGPLCGSILADAGADVVKVESTGRPDGARRGPAAFHDLMNAGKRSVAVDFSTPSGRAHLGALVRSADVVLEASRPRALEQLGSGATEVMVGGGPQVWVSLTGHGRTGAGRDRVGFGDDAAVAGGLVAWDGDQPSFCLDAVADPLSGLVAADLVFDLLGRGGRWLADVALARVAASFTGPTVAVGSRTVAAPPTVRRHRGRARALGADNDAVLSGRRVGRV